MVDKVVNEYYEIHNGDCIEVMDKMIEEGVKVDCIITDVPQEITQNSWDKAIPFEAMWERLYKLRRSTTTPIILLSNQPFTSQLVCSNIKDFKVMKYWQKDRPSGFLNAKKMPLRDIEDIVIFAEEVDDVILRDIAIFYEKQCVYNPQMEEGKPNNSIGKAKGKDSLNNNYGSFKSMETKKDGLKYPRQILKYPRPHPPQHPTEKSVSMLMDLIRTYSNEGDTVLDFTMGVGSTGKGCIMEGRYFIGIEIGEDFYTLAKESLSNLICEW